MSFGIEEEDEVVGDAPSAGGNQTGAAGQNVAAKRGGGAAQNPKAGLLMLDHGLVGQDDSKEDMDEQLPVANQTSQFGGQISQ